MEHPTSSELVSSPLFGIRIVVSSIDFKPPRVTCREIGTVIITWGHICRNGALMIFNSSNELTCRNGWQLVSSPAGHYEHEACKLRGQKPWHAHFHLKVTADPAVTSATTGVPESPPMPQFISLLEPGTVCVAHQHRISTDSLHLSPGPSSWILRITRWGTGFW